MADHINQQVLDAIKATLVAAGTDAAARVYLDRLDPVPESELPAILIEGVGEVVEVQSVSFPPIYLRQYSLTISWPGIRLRCGCPQPGQAGRSSPVRKPHCLHGRRACQRLAARWRQRGQRRRRQHRAV